jgi:hypothetical protein
MPSTVRVATVETRTITNSTVTTRREVELSLLRRRRIRGSVSHRRPYRAVAPTRCRSPISGVAGRAGVLQRDYRVVGET